MATMRAKPTHSMVTLLLAFSLVSAAPPVFGQQKPEYRVKGTQMEGCTCNLVCSCSFTGKRAQGCKGINVWAVSSGSYQGVDLAGAKFASGSSGQKKYLYVDSSDAQREAAAAAAKAILGSGPGKIQAVKNAKIDLSGSGGRYTLNINGGKTAQLTTEPLMGNDKKTPSAHTNAMSYPIMQGRTLTGSFHEPGLSFKLKNTNSFFSDDAEETGKP